MTTNFKITSSAKMLAILAVVTGAKLNFKVEGDQLVMNGKEPGTEGNKEWQNATLLAKYIRDYVNASKGTMEARIKNVVGLLRGLSEVTTFRTLNNQLRRSTDDGSVFPVGTYFYEGTGHPLKVAARTATTVKKTKTIAPKATPKVTPAPKAKKIVKATTGTKATATAKAAKPANKPAKAAPKAKKVKPVIVPGAEAPLQNVADNTPDVIEAPEVAVVPAEVEQTA